MKVLVLGSGAREHALVKAAAADPEVDAVIAAPGNPGIDATALCVPVDILDGEAVAALAREHEVDLVVVGPEAPLVAGVADACRAAGFAVFGPSAAAAMLEGSKAFAKEVMAAAEVPTALAHVCTTIEQVEAALDALGAPHVVKDDGLAAGKGVVVTDDRDEALAHARRLPRQARRAARRRGVPRRARGLRLLPVRRRRRRRRSPRRRTSSASPTTTPDPTRAGWAPTRR